ARFAPLRRPRRIVGAGRVVHHSGCRPCFRSRVIAADSRNRRLSDCHRHFWALQMTDPSSHEQTRRRWKWLALIPLVPVLAFAALFAFDWYQGQRAWREACAEADRLDPGWKWEDLLARRPELPADRD